MAPTSLTSALGGVSGHLDAPAAVLPRKSREAGWSLQSVSTLWKREDCLYPACAGNEI
jgi:hypothetical protein